MYHFQVMVQPIRSGLFWNVNSSPSYARFSAIGLSACCMYSSANSSVPLERKAVTAGW
ncbi:MAG: hypothetical protein ACC608_00765 [Anaerofustis sp.]